MTSSKNLRLEVSITKKYMANKAYIIDDARLMAEWDWEKTTDTL